MVPAQGFGLPRREGSSPPFQCDITRRCPQVGAVRVLVGPNPEIQRPTAEVVSAGCGLRIVAGQGTVEVIEPGVLFDANHFVAPLISPAVECAQIRVFLVAKEVPVAPKRQLIEEVQNAVGRRRVSGPQRELRITQSNQILVGRSERRVARPTFGRLDEGEQLDGLKASIKLAFVRLEILRIPTTPTGGFSIHIDEFPPIAY